MKQFKTCDICGVSNEAKRVTYSSKYNMCLCNKHAAQLRRHGKIIDTTSRTTNDKNEIIEYSDHAEIVLRNKKNEIVATTMIDLEDVEKVSERKWNVLPNKKRMYAYSKYPTHIKLHRLVLGYFGPLEIDHINRNSLDNRKQNLRVVTRSENASNTNAKNIRLRGKKWEYDVVRYGQRFCQYGFNTYEEARDALKERLKDVSNRVNELIDQFNEQREINPFKGVYWHYGKYQTAYYHNGRKYSAGTFDTPEEAREARDKLINEINANKEKAYA